MCVFVLCLCFPFSTFHFALTYYFFSTCIYTTSPGKPIIFEIGLGPWKKRLIGPEKTKDALKDEEDEKIDMTVANAPLLLVFGSAKYAGDFR